MSRPRMVLEHPPRAGERPLRRAPRVSIAVLACIGAVSSLPARAQSPAPAAASPPAAAAPTPAPSAPVGAAGSWTKATTVFVNTVLGSRTGGSARRINESHAEMEAKGWRFLDLEAYSENGDLVGFFVTYVR